MTLNPRFNWRHQYDQTRDEIEGDLAGTVNNEPSRTVQSFAPDADLNVIAKRFGINGIPTTPIDPANFRDTTQDPDLRQVLEHQREAKDSFRALPEKLRKRFHNDPLEMWTFVNDPDNAEEAVRLGLLTRRNADADADPANTSTTTSRGTATANTNAPEEPKKAPPTPPQKETP